MPSTTTYKNPYKFQEYDHTAYKVIDRETGEEVGYVLGGFTGWYAMREGIELAHARYRDDAGRLLWERWSKR